MSVAGLEGVICVMNPDRASSGYALSVNSPLEVAWIPSLLAAMACRLEGRSLVRWMSERMRLTLVPESARAVGRWVSEARAFHGLMWWICRDSSCIGRGDFCVWIGR